MMTRIRTNFCMDNAVIEFADKESRNRFVLNPQFNFDFCLNNVDDKKGVNDIFGNTFVTPEFPTGDPKFLVTFIKESEDEENIAEVSVEIEMEFCVKVTFDEFLEWVEGDGESWRHTGRIECAGEISLRSTDREEYEKFENIV